MIANGALTLLRHPEALERLRREPSTMGETVELRHHQHVAGPARGQRLAKARPSSSRPR